jgi:hypothetical protein
MGMGWTPLGNERALRESCFLSIIASMLPDVKNLPPGFGSWGTQARKGDVTATVAMDTAGSVFAIYVEAPGGGGRFQNVGHLSSVQRLNRSRSRVARGETES